MAREKRANWAGGAFFQLGGTSGHTAQTERRNEHDGGEGGEWKKKSPWLDTLVLCPIEPIGGGLPEQTKTDHRHPAKKDTEGAKEHAATKGETSTTRPNPSRRDQAKEVISRRGKRISQSL